MTAAAPDERTPLLCSQQVPAIRRVAEPEPEPVPLAGPLNQSSRTPSADRGSDVTNKTPLPWGQLSVVLFLQLAEPLTAQVISPVGSTYLSLRLLNDTGPNRPDRPLNAPPLSSQFTPEVSSGNSPHSWDRQINSWGRFRVAHPEVGYCKERGGGRLLCWNYRK